MTLEFKFPEDQTNLLALDGTIYKIKLSYEADCAAQNKLLNVGACIDVVKKELEEALRAIVLMFINNQPLRPVKTRHFKFYTNCKPWRASHKLKFRYNGDDLQTSEDFLDINVWTKETASPGLREFVNSSKVCGDLSPHLSAQDHKHLAQSTSEINIQTGSGRRYSSSPVVVDGRASKRKVKLRRTKLRGSSSKRKRLSPARKKSSASSRSSKRKKTILKKKKSISRRKSSTTRKRSFDWNFNNVVGEQNTLSEKQTPSKRPFTRSQISTASSKDKTPSTSITAEKRSYNVQSQPGPSHSSYQYNDNNNIATESITQQPETQSEPSPVAKIRKRTLLRKARLDQFVVQEEEMAEESKLQQLAQPLRSSPRKAAEYGMKAPAQRLSLGSTLNLILTPFKMLTRSVTNR